MKFLIDLISEQLSGAFEKAGFDAAYGRATLSNLSLIHISEPTRP